LVGAAGSDVVGAAAGARVVVAGVVVVVSGACDVVAELDPVSCGTVVSADGVRVRGVLDGSDGVELGGTSEVDAGAGVGVGVGVPGRVVTGDSFLAGVPDDEPDAGSVATGGTNSSPAMTNSAASTTVDVRALPMRLGTERGQMRRRVVAGAVVTCGEVVARSSSVGSSVPAGFPSGDVLTLPPRWCWRARRWCSR
jgi:hypothetical protein